MTVTRIGVDGQHAYQVVVTDPLQAGCTADDPTIQACVEESRPIAGNPGGAIEVGLGGGENGHGAHCTAKGSLGRATPLTTDQD